MRTEVLQQALSSVLGGEFEKEKTKAPIFIDEKGGRHKVLMVKPDSKNKIRVEFRHFDKGCVIHIFSKEDYYVINDNPVINKLKKGETCRAIIQDGTLHLGGSTFALSYPSAVLDDPNAICRKFIVEFKDRREAPITGQITKNTRKAILQELKDRLAITHPQAKVKITLFKPDPNSKNPVENSWVVRIADPSKAKKEDNGPITRRFLVAIEGSDQKLSGELTKNSRKEIIADIKNKLAKRWPGSKAKIVFLKPDKDAKKTVEDSWVVRIPRRHNKGKQA